MNPEEQFENVISPAKFIKEVEESDVMPEEKQAALNIATS